MTIFVYTATESLASGHVLGNSYTVDFDVQTAPRKSAVTREVSRSLSGKTETLIHRVDRSFDITFAPVNGARRAALYELLDSIMDGQTVLVYLYGSEANPLPMICESDSYSDNVFMAVGSVDADYVTAQITMRVAQ